MNLQPCDQNCANNGGCSRCKEDKQIIEPIVVKSSLAIEPMKIGQVNYEEFWGDENDPSSDWSQIQHYATFGHKDDDACEFIIHLGNVDDGSREEILKAFEIVFSSVFMDCCHQASEAGYKYLCFYA